MHKSGKENRKPVRTGKLAKEFQRESEEKYRTILENIEDGYYEVDLAGNFTFFNNSLCKLSGCSRDELLGMNNLRFIDKQPPGKFSKCLTRFTIPASPPKDSTGR